MHHVKGSNALGIDLTRTAKVFQVLGLVPVITFIFSLVFFTTGTTN